MDVLHPRCCGLDVHKSSISACILVQVAGRVQKHQRRFGAMTRDLQELANWLRQFEATQVAMESSGVYWKPVWNILEGQCFLGLRPGRRNSGKSEPQLHISKEGDRYLRTLMVQGRTTFWGLLDRTAIYGAGG